MNNRLQLYVLGISHSQHQPNAYVLVLGEKDGQRRIPIVIGSIEAQAIALQLENFVSPRPLTHDLFITLSESFGIELLEVTIYKFENGVFYAELLFFNGEKQVKIDARTSDSIALALRFHCPVYIYEEIMEQTSITVEKESTPDSQSTSSKDITTTLGDEWALYTNDELNNMLDDAIEQEDYETASKIRDEIKRRASKSST